MFKNESIKIIPGMNGYRIDYDYRYANPTADNPKNWDYADEEYMFKTWDEVVEFVTNKQLEIPSVKIN